MNGNTDYMMKNWLWIFSFDENIKMLFLDKKTLWSFITRNIPKYNEVIFLG